MSSQPLSDFVSVNRRYARSINLEHDFDVPEAVEGYVLTERSIDALRRIIASVFGRKRTTAWTLTGVYGTGKSAFVHFLTSLFGPVNSPARQIALDIARHSLQPDSPEYEILQKKFPQAGLFRAVATAQREPISHTVVRALYKAADDFWARGREPKIAKQIADWATELEFGEVSFRDRDVLNAVRQLSEVVETDIILVIDELGKCLEFASQNQAAADLYLLQQLAELSRKKATRIYILGLLHQSFTDYSQRLASLEKNEWGKIQGRFEDIPFTESSRQMLQLMGRAIERNTCQTKPLANSVSRLAEEWGIILSQKTNLADLPPQLIEATYPLHPLAALVLSELCIHFAQNDRSLFTFLTSAEPYAFQSFIETQAIKEGALPTLKLHHLYDYFEASLGMGLGPTQRLQRWLEIQTLVADAKHKDESVVVLLKTIGLLNLVTSTGRLKATQSLVKLALIDYPDADGIDAWESVINQVCHQQGIVTYRCSTDELRLWEGSDFDVEGAIAEYIAKENLPLAALMAETNPLKPMVAQRHSYRTGTLRYFEHHYLDKAATLETISCTQEDCDGVVAYWLREEAPPVIPAQTLDGKPLVVIAAANLPLLRLRAQEYRALCQLYSRESALQTDKTARQEVRYRRLQLKQLLDDTLTQAFNFGTHHNACWVDGQPTAIASIANFNALLSAVCDRTYPQTPILWNELINRRVLTSQGAKARRVLLEVMLEQPEVERLGLEGYGPEVAMYYSVLQQTSIHRQEQGEWGFHPPPATSMQPIWAAIAAFCLDVAPKPRSLRALYQQLEAPPYGIKRGMLPVLMAAVLIYYADDVSVYKDGTFIPILGSEHFELLVKDPSRFAVKYVQMDGLRVQVFRQLEDIILNRKTPKAANRRNATLLSVVEVLVRFASGVHPFTKQTQLISAESQAALKALLRVQEPDDLLFQSLPAACGMAPLAPDADRDLDQAQALCDKLINALREIRDAYETHVLNHGRKLLCDAFETDPQYWRAALRERARLLVKKVIDNRLKQFLNAAIEEDKPEQDWLEALLFVIVDKPLTYWVDADLMTLELNLAQLIKQLLSLEVLQRQVALKQAESGRTFRAYKITLTANNGNEQDDISIIERDQEPALEAVAQEFLADERLNGDPKQQKAIAALMLRHLLNLDAQTVDELAAKRSQPPIPSRRRKRSGSA